VFNIIETAESYISLLCLDQNVSYDFLFVFEVISSLTVTVLLRYKVKTLNAHTIEEFND